MYATEAALTQALKLVWPEKAIADAKQIAKSLKGVLGNIHYKRRRMSSGNKTSPLLREFLSRVDAPALPISRQPSKTEESLTPKKTRNRTTESGLGKATKPMPSSGSAIGTGKSNVSIASLYGFASPQDTLASQITISDELGASQQTIPDTSLDEVCKNSWSYGEESHGYWFDHEAMCLVKAMKGQQIEKSDMRPGKHGFCEAVFKDGDIQDTEIPNLELFPTGLKRPASVMKKPACAAPVAISDEESAHMSQPPGHYLVIKILFSSFYLFITFQCFQCFYTFYTVYTFYTFYTLFRFLLILYS